MFHSKLFRTFLPTSLATVTLLGYNILNNDGVNNNQLIQAEDIQEHYFNFKSEDDLELIKVQIINRHGARTPINTLPNYIDNKPWKCLPFDSGVEQSKFTTIFEENGLELLGNCMKGQLTEGGAIQMFKVGEHLREKYFTKLFAVNNQVLNYEDVINSMYVRSSDIRSRRTEFSLMYLLQGFLGSNQAYYPTIHMYEESRETLYGHFKMCAKLGGIIGKRIKKLDEDAEEDPGFLEIKGRLLKVFYPDETTPAEEPTSHEPQRDKGLIEAKQIRQVKDFPQWESLNNAFAGMIFHGHDLPKGITMKDVDYISTKVGAIGSFLFGGADVLKMNTGMLVKELVDSMKKSILTSKGQDRRKLEIYLGHDTTLIPLLVTLNLYSGVWPPFASSLILELYVNKSEPNQHFVKIVYNDQTMKFKQEGLIIQDDKSGLIPFEEFERVLKPYMLTHKDWKLLCKK